MRAVPGALVPAACSGPLRSLPQNPWIRPGPQIPIALDPQQAALGVSDRDYVSTGGGRIGEQGPDHRHGPIERRGLRASSSSRASPPAAEYRPADPRLRARLLPRLDDQ